LEGDEMLQDIRDYDAVKKALESGEEEVIPSRVVYALVDGENPIRVWREYLGLTQKQLAETAGISAAYLSQIESGKRTGTAEILTALAQALNLTLEDILPKNSNLL
jgi:DNA-binding XRE family transcriptional regulator